MTDALITRSEVFAGLVNQQASSIIFQIENRTARLICQTRQVRGRYTTEQTQDEIATYIAERAARAEPGYIRPTIRDLEHYAPQWAERVPKRNSLRAAIAHKLGEKYVFTLKSVPRIRAALGLDDPAVKAEFERQFHKPLDSIYTGRLGPINALLWGATRISQTLERLPPFWTIYAFTLTETVGASILALPIAVAKVGAVPGLILIGILGLVNVLTIAAMAESVARNGSIRFGSAFIGRVVADYLGPVGSALLSVGMFGLLFFALQLFYTGLASALHDATGIVPSIWVAVAFIVGAFMVTRKSLNSTIASALLVGLINLLLLLTISVIGLTHLDIANLQYTRLPGAEGFDIATLGLVFGAVLASYFGHLSLSYGARNVLSRDPSARSLILGAMAAQVTALLLYGLFVFAVNGAVSPQLLADEQGTALAPLAATIGAGVKIPGTLFALLGMGMGSIHMSMGLTNLVNERLPRQSEPVLLLTQRQGNLRLHPRGNVHGDLNLAVTYLGLVNGDAHFRIDQSIGRDAQRSQRRMEIVAAPHWEMPIEAGQTQPDSLLKITVLDAVPNTVRVKISTPLAVRYEGDHDVSGLHLTQMGELPDEQRQLIAWILRQGGVALSEITKYLEAPAIEVRPLVEELVAAGFLNQVAEGSSIRYRAFLTGRRQSRLPDALWDKASPRTKASRRQVSFSRALIRRVALLGPRLRVVITLIPVALAFLMVEWGLMTGTASFTELLGVIGSVVVPLLGGIFPVLMLAAARRRGDHVPRFVIEPLGSKPVLIVLGSVFFIALLIYGLLLGSGLFERGAALFAAGSMLALTGVLVRSQGFAPRLIIEVRQDARPHQVSSFHITADGKPLTTRVSIDHEGHQREFESAAGELLTLKPMQHFIFDLPPTRAADLKVWVHRITQSEISEALPCDVDISVAGVTRSYQIAEGDDYLIIPMRRAACRIEITLREPGSA